MTTKVSGVLLVVVLTACVTWAVAQDRGAAARTVERNIVVTEEKEPCKVKTTDWIRLTGSTPSGGTVSAESKGPVRLIQKNVLTRVVGLQVAIGALETEFEFQPTGKGKAEVTITATGPVPGSEPVRETFTFTVQ